MPQHLGFRDRLPANFGSENLRDKAVFFDDFMADPPTEGAWKSSSFGGQEQGMVETVPGGVYNFGIGNLTTGQGIWIFTSRNFDVSKQMLFGARVMFGESWANPSLDYSTNQMGMFVGMQGGDTFAANQFAFGKAYTGWGIGFIRDNTTANDIEATLIQAGYWYTDGGATTIVLENIEPSAGFQADTFHDYGMSFSPSGVVRFTVDDEQVAEMKPVFRSGQMYGPAIAAFNSNGDSETYPMPVAVDWSYCSQERADRKPFA